MREVFQQELAEVQERLVAIAESVHEAITLAQQAFSTSDVALAERVIEGDQHIDAQADELDELAIDVIARQGPVARDLRILVSSLRISASLERMGDLARHIATLARYRFPDAVVPEPLISTFERMGELDIEIARLNVELLKTENLEYHEKISELDIELDELHKSVFDSVLAEEWNEPANATVDVTLASRYHERFADHAVTIGKKIQYLSTGDWAPAEEEA
ncbi:phosphate signaling complex protein PhoU [uncultured Agrococcus sp.]|uniref:phosphate signaling complex protein PhoU n=1 Tax=uncultured Agrococcus sp. TaxID=382258 RepID=UPI0025F20810|nr:phosphate signaling complex protein PhoU [uncultured Agrococcus sp.]